MDVGIFLVYKARNSRPSDIPGDYNKFAAEIRSFAVSGSPGVTGVIYYNTFSNWYHSWIYGNRRVFLVSNG